MKLAYRAFDSTGRSLADTIEAGDRAEATETLRRRGLFVTEIGQAGAGGPGSAAKAEPAR